MPLRVPQALRSICLALPKLLAGSANRTGCRQHQPRRIPGNGRQRGLQESCRDRDCCNSDRARKQDAWQDVDVHAAGQPVIPAATRWRRLPPRKPARWRCPAAQASTHRCLRASPTCLVPKNSSVGVNRSGVAEHLRAPYRGGVVGCLASVRVRQRDNIRAPRCPAEPVHERPCRLATSPALIGADATARTPRLNGGPRNGRPGAGSSAGLANGASRFRARLGVCCTRSRHSSAQRARDLSARGCGDQSWLGSTDIGSIKANE